MDLGRAINTKTNEDYNQIHQKQAFMKHTCDGFHKSFRLSMVPRRNIHYEPIWNWKRNFKTDKQLHRRKNLPNKM